MTPKLRVGLGSAQLMAQGKFFHKSSKINNHRSNEKS